MICVLRVFVVKDCLPTQRRPATITEPGGKILLWHPAVRTAPSDFQVRAARRAEISARAVCRATRAAAARQRRHVAACFARDVFFDYLPRVFRDFVLPVSTECGECKQRWKGHGADSSHGRFVEPLLHSDLHARAAGLWSDLDRER